MAKEDPIEIRRRDLTRELWAKYNWLDCSQHGAPDHIVRGLERMPDDAMRAWNEFDVFAKLWNIEEPPEDMEYVRNAPVYTVKDALKWTMPFTPP